jgi:hypothetical protein
MPHQSWEKMQPPTTNTEWNSLWSSFESSFKTTVKAAESNVRQIGAGGGTRTDVSLFHSFFYRESDSMVCVCGQVCACTEMTAFELIPCARPISTLLCSTCASKATANPKIC